MTPSETRAGRHRASGCLRGIAAASIGALCGLAAAQTVPSAPAAGRGLAVSASLGAGLSYSDNSGLVGEAQGGDFLTTISPGLSVAMRGGRVQGTLEYSLNIVRHSRQTDAATLQNALNAAFTVEAVPSWLYVDTTASISQQALSAYGQQLTTYSVDGNPNRAEVGTLAVSPHAAGLIGDIATYSVRASATTTNTRHSVSGDSSGTSGQVSLGSPSSGALFGWGAQATQSRSVFRLGRTTETTGVTLSLIMRPDPEVSLTARGGQQYTNVLTLERKRYGSWGADASWTPSTRTKALLSFDHQYYGDSYIASIEHRLANSILNFSATQTAVSGADVGGGTITLYQLYYALYASVQPDPVLRDQLVLALLQSLGLNPNAAVGGGFVNNAPTLQRRMDLGWTYSGQRTTYALQAFSSEVTTLDPSAPTLGDGRTRQLGATASVARRLTPRASATLSGSWQRTLDSGSLAGNSLKSIALTWSDQLTLRSTLSLSGGYSLFRSPTAPYHQSSLAANYGLRF